MRVAVTGASGFIGRHVLAELARHGVEICAVTRDPARLQGAPAGVRVVTMDLARPGADPFARLGSPDLLIHLAWDGLPNYRSQRHLETELPRQYRFLRALVAAGLSSLFVAGTCFEYGMQSGALREDAPAAPDNPYGSAKEALRQRLEALQESHPFHLVWGRLFYLYGPGQAATSLYGSLKGAVERGEQAFDMSGGEQLRDYLPVETAARHIVTLALSGRGLGTVNICSGTPVSVRSLVDGWLAAQRWNIALNPGHYPYPDYEPMAFWGDAGRLRQLLGSSSES